MGIGEKRGQGPQGRMGIGVKRQGGMGIGVKRLRGQTEIGAK